MPTYLEQYNKIIQAYFRDEIKPMNSKFCFCGTLHGGWGWRVGDKEYTAHEFEIMEEGLLFIGKFYNTEKLAAIGHQEYLPHPLYEEYLFEGMCNALDVLKQIHIERGENIDEGEVPAFKKRDLALSKS